MSLKEEKYAYVMNRVDTDVFYEDAVCLFKEMYISGLGTAYMKKVFNDNERQEKIKDVVIRYVNYLNSKGKIKNEKLLVENLYVDVFSLFANMAFNKEMYPDASLEKYIKEAPELNQVTRDLLAKPIPEILINIENLRKVTRVPNNSRNYSSSEEALMDYFAHVSVAKLIENTFLDRLDNHFINDMDINSVENQKFLTINFSNKLSDSFVEFPKAVKVLKTINLKVIDELAELLLREQDENKFEENFEKLSALWNRTVIAYPKEDLITENMKQVFERHFRKLSTIDTEKSLKIIGNAIYKGDSLEKLRNLVENLNPDYISNLLKKQSAIEDEGTELVYTRSIRVKEKYFREIFHNHEVMNIKKDSFFVLSESKSNLDGNYVGENYYILKIKTKEMLNNLSLDNIIDVINEVFPKNSIINQEKCDQCIRALVLKNKVSEEVKTVTARKKL